MIHFCNVWNLDALSCLLIHNFLQLVFVDLKKVLLLLILFHISLDHLDAHLFKFVVLALKLCELLAKFLEELLDDAGKLVDPDLSVSGTLGMLVLKEVLELTVDAQVLLNVKKLLSVALSYLSRMNKLFLMVLLQALNYFLIYLAVIASIY